MRTKKLQEQDLRESIGQTWLLNTYSKHYTDQFGFSITYGTVYTLFYQEQQIVKVHSLMAAKVISNVILNDIVMNKSL